MGPFRQHHQKHSKRSTAFRMSRTLATIGILSLLLFNAALPVFALSTLFPVKATERIEPPYEKVIAKSGSWYTEQITTETRGALVAAYSGSYDAKAQEDLLSVGDMASTDFVVKEKSVLRGILLPFTGSTSDTLDIALVDTKGNHYGPFKAQSTSAYAVTRLAQNASPDALSQDPLYDAKDFTFATEADIVLEPGTYTLMVSPAQGWIQLPGGDFAFLVKGLNHSGHDRYMKDVRAKSGSEVPVAVGSDVLVSTTPETYVHENSPAPAKRQPAAFELTEESLVEKIVFNTYNDGAGALPGTVTLLDEKGQPLMDFQTSGGALAGVPNSLWIAAPNVILPPGVYYLGMSNPEVVTYDAQGAPQFYVYFSPAPQERYDFTGTYKIDLDTYKTSTLMGPVSGGASTFSLRDFELTVIERGNTLELIGVYEGMPFSQRAEIVEESETHVTARFDFSADLSNLPYKAKVGAMASVTLLKQENLPPMVSITGTGTFERAASSTKGADYNTYDIEAGGAMVTRDLPPFVMAALGTAGVAGTVPGPANPAQGAVGLLFPPLVGLVVHVLQELLKPKPVLKKYSPEWYAKQYPGKSKEELAWIMLADAMGNTDEPDADPESMSSGGSDGGSGASESEGNDESYGENTAESEEDAGDETESSAVEPEPTPEPAAEPEASSEDKSEAEPSKTAGDTETAASDTQKEPAPEQPQLPDTLTLQVDHTGRTVTYERDPETGEYVNPQTGGVLDLERYEKDVRPNFEKDKAFIDGEREKLEKGETAFDKEIRAAAAKRKEEAAKEAYMEKLMSKYGERDPEKLMAIINERQARDKEWADTWETIGKINGALESGAMVVGVVADVGVDGLAAVTGKPGEAIRAAYKVTKGIAGNMADKGISGESFAAGAIKGGTDAASDFINSPYKKAAVTMAGEIFGSAVNEVGNKDSNDSTAIKAAKGALDGMIDGVFKVTVGTVTDKISSKAGGGSFGNTDYVKQTLKNGQVRIAINNTGKWSGRNVSPEVAKKFVSNKITRQAIESGTKITSGLLDEFVTKPYVADPIKNSY